MKVKISIKTPLNKYDFPIVFYFSSSYEDKKEKLIFSGFRSKVKDWDSINLLPKKNNPLYFYFFKS
jgi:hypothetical protein